MGKIHAVPKTKVDVPLGLNCFRLSLAPNQDLNSDYASLFFPFPFFPNVRPESADYCGRSFLRQGLYN